jgi:hypothetical protein
MTADAEGSPGMSREDKSAKGDPSRAPVITAASLQSPLPLHLARSS